jgi:RND family efflux transporter MFP subunit
MRWGKIIAVLFMASLGGFGIWAWQMRPVQVATVSIGRGAAIQVVYATGVVEPVHWAKVGPLTTGRIAEIFARDGDALVAGDRLARLDDREARARLAELEARERYWREELSRQTQLAERGHATRDARDRAQSEYLQIVAGVAAQRQRIADLTLLTPMDGIVLRQDGEVGETVEAKSTLFWVGRPRPLRVIAEVDEEDIPRVTEGYVAHVKSDAFPGTVLSGRVADITPKGDPVAKSYRVRIALPEDSRLRIGMTTEVNIVVREVADAVLAPVAALHGPAGSRYVFLPVRGQVQRRSVRLGIEGRTMVEILEGLVPGDDVIVAPPPGIDAGRRIVVVPAIP